MNIGAFLKKIFNPRPKVDYVSDVDQFMENFNRTHKPSASQQAEIKKHQRVATLRDTPQPQDLASKIWEDF